ncbi:MAG: hypothetical protein MJ138_06695, partial [Kiritimatiellae bacterium]|nr:hypothetical protein [Kiritimatiellia bacterium]
MGKKEKGNEPPSLFDNMDLFAVAAEPAAKPAVGGEAAAAGENEEGGGAAAEPAAKPAEKPAAAASGLTGHGPMRDLYDFNFRAYSAYVICDRAIPAVEDGLKPVQRRIM